MDFSTINAPAGGAAPGTVGAACSSAAPQTPPENCEAVVFVSQIVKLIIPHNTPRFKGIRDFIKSYILNERNERVFIFRTESGWTTVGFNSRPDVPVITINPVRACELVTQVLSC